MRGGFGRKLAGWLPPPHGRGTDRREGEQTVFVTCCGTIDTLGSGSSVWPVAHAPELDAAAPSLFVINAASGSSGAAAKRGVIEAAWRAGGRHGELRFCNPKELVGVAQQAATQAIAPLELLRDREAYKSRFGRSRWVAFVAACATLLRAQRQLRLHIEMGATVRDVQTLTLFIGNNRLQLQQFGAAPEDTLAGALGDGSMAALMLGPIGTRSMIRLVLQGAMGRLGEAAGVESFEFQHMVVKPTLVPGRKEVVVAFDGEVARMRAPIDIRVLDRPLYLLHAARAAGPAHEPMAAAGVSCCTSPAPTSAPNSRPWSTP